MKAIRVLVAEDNEGDVFLVKEALRLHNLEFHLHVETDGLAAIRYIENVGHTPEAPCPDVFLLDLNLPKVDGYDVLNTLRAHHTCSRVPVIIVTSSDAPKDWRQAELLDAKHYFRKPSDLTEFMALGAVVREAIRGTLDRTDEGTESGNAS
ncbi:MAG TPA: response regulator [Bryobacteraceae bacterium]|jgi:CheY-like chemotaxis protein|nr:response regulator [Bryobacteraceae bacterium]